MPPAESSLTTWLTTWRIDFRSDLNVVLKFSQRDIQRFTIPWARWRSEKLRKWGSRSCERVFRKGEVVRWRERVSSFSRRTRAESRFRSVQTYHSWTWCWTHELWWHLYHQRVPSLISIVFSPCCAGPREFRCRAYRAREDSACKTESKQKGAHD